MRATGRDSQGVSNCFKNNSLSCAACAGRPQCPRGGAGVGLQRSGRKCEEGG